MSDTDQPQPASEADTDIDREPAAEDAGSADTSALDRAAAAIDEAKQAASDVDLPGEHDLIDDEDLPVADHAEPADGPAPAA